MEQKERLIWVDHVKLFACILVVLGHLFPSLTAPGIFPNWRVLSWFHDFVYTFHVPLFFICSGYLYQKFTKINSFRDYGICIANKFLALGIPYFVFSFATWAMKTLFSDSVNNQIGGLAKTLFISPVAPYWYLYVLLFLFVFILPAKNNKMLVLELVVASILKVLSLCAWVPNVYILTSLCAYSIWFVLGMCLAKWMLMEKINKKNALLPASFATLLAIGGSVACYLCKLDVAALNFAVGVCACVATLLWMVMFANGGDKPVFLARYTMPIYLLHTIFAAGIRIVMLKVGIENGVLHLLIGLVFSIVVPMVVGMVGEKLKIVDFFFYPTKYIKVKKCTQAEKE